MRTRFWMVARRISAGILVGMVILTILTGSTSFAQQNRGSALGAASTSATAPESLAELIARSPLVVTGTVEKFLAYSEARPYRDGHALTNAFGVSLFGLPTTDYLLRVETVIRDNGAIANDGTIVLREFGHITDALRNRTRKSSFPPSNIGDHYLFILEPYPDGEGYGAVFGPWGRLILDGDVLRMSNGTRDLWGFDDHPAPITLDEFTRIVHEADKAAALTPQPTQPVSPIPTPVGARVRGTADQYSAPPYDLYALSAPDALVVIATVGPVAREAIDCDAPSSTAAADCPADALQPVTDFELEIEEVIRDSFGITAFSETVWLREPGSSATGSGGLLLDEHYPPSHTGERYLFILSPTGDGQTYAPSFGPWGRLIIDGDNLRLSNATRDPLRFDDFGQVTLEKLREFEQGRTYR